MMLYSFRGSRPAPLPFRITLPNGFTRTDPSTFTEDEITDAGFSGPYVEPSYNPATEELIWVDGAYTISVLPPPPPIPRWVDFATALGADTQVNQFIAALAQTVPVLHLMIGVGLGQAAQGDSQTFLAAWATAVSQNLISTVFAEHIQTIAKQHDLPKVFVNALQLPSNNLNEDPVP